MTKLKKCKRKIAGIKEGIGHCALEYRATEKARAVPRKENYVYYIR